MVTKLLGDKILESKHIIVLIIDAIKENKRDLIVKLITENPDQVDFYTPFGGQTWLGYAAQIGNLDAVVALVDAGLDVNLGDKYDDSKPLCSAASNNHYDVAEYLLSVGALMDVSLSVRNPLFAAIVGRSPKIVSLLLREGIDSKVRYNSETMKDMDAVAFALMRGEVECAQMIALWNANGDEQIAKVAIDEANKVAEENAR